MALTDYPAGLPVRTESDADEKVQVKLVDYLNPTQGAEIDVNKDLHVRAKIVDKNGADFTEANPLPVIISETSGVEVHDYKQDDIAQAGSANHDYTAAALLRLHQVLFSGSGAGRCEVQVETAAASGIFNTKAVMYISAADQNEMLTFKVPLVVASGAKVRLVKTNRDKGTQSLSTTIIGVE